MYFFHAMARWRRPALRQNGKIIRSTALEVADRDGASVDFSKMHGLKPVQMDQSLQDILRNAAENACPNRWRNIQSGALHDAANVAKLMPAAMLFYHP